MNVAQNDDKLRRLLEVGRALVSELDLETVLQRILDEAREITGARYVALGVLDEQRRELERFLTSGIDPETGIAIGEKPRGRGVLGVLIKDPRPLRLTDVARHSQSFGFPAGHPEMKTFLGVLILIRGQAWGNLYLTEKHAGAEFTEADEEAAVVLAQWAATAIENARLYETSELRRVQAERAVLGLRAARDITDAIAGAGELDPVLELIVERGRALVDARTVLIMLREGDELVVAASAGRVDRAEGHRLPISGSTSGLVLERGRPQRVDDVSTHLRITPDRLGVPDAHTALLVPMLHQGNAVGVLAAFDRGRDGAPFSPEHEELLRTFASSAANAVTIHRSVEADRLRATISAADAERGRWARELHDQTLQALGGLRVLLATALRRDDAEEHERAMRQAIEDIEPETDNLRAMISDLRPSLLDDLGLRPAIEALSPRGVVCRVTSRLSPRYDTAPSAPPREPTGQTTYLARDHAVLERVSHQVRARAEPELLLYVRAVSFDRAYREEQLLGNLGVGVAERDQAQHLHLALGQAAGRSPRRLGGDPRAEPGVQIAVPSSRAPDCLDQFGVGGVLQYISEDARGERLTGIGRLVLHGQHHDPCIRCLGPDVGDRVEARAFRHVQVEHEHIGMMAPDVPARALDVAGLGHDLEVTFVFEQLSQTPAHDRVIVGDHDSDGARIRRLRLLARGAVRHQAQVNALSSSRSSESMYGAR